MSPPSAFGTYRVLHQIGSGVLGPVFRAYDSQRDRLVAIKTFKLDLVPEDAARLADRLRALAAERPAHPVIVGGVDAGLEGSTPYIALDYASGESLDALLRQSGAWTVARALPVLREIALAIDASWATDVGHGALHPRDIFISTGPADVRVTGFGIGQALEAVGAKAPVRRPYSAAERGDEASWDVRADVYSLGVVACEMLSGQRPVGSDDEGEAVALRLAQDGPGELSPEASAAVQRVLAVAMAELPADRYETAAAFVEALAGAAEPASVAPAAEVQTAPKRAARIKRPRPVVLDLPLLAGLDPSEDVGRAVEPEPPEDVGRAFRPGDDGGAEAPPYSNSESPSPIAEPEPVPVAVAGPEFQDAGRALRPGDVEIDVGRAFRPGRDEGDVFRPGSNGGAEAPPYSGSEAAESELVAAFPWAAVLAVVAAGLVLSGVAYQWGWNRGNAAARLELTGPAPTQTQTPAEIPTPVVEPAATPEPTPAASPAPSPSPAAEAAAAGRLVIQSVPSGALVTIDGRRAGETPLTMSVPLGRHEIHVARPGYVPKVERVELTQRSASRTLRVQLRRGAGGTAGAAPATGSVDVDSRPRGARVLIDGRLIGTTPLRVPELTAGDHRIQFELAGHTTVTSTVNIVGGELTRVAVTLERSGWAQAPGRGVNR